METGSTLKQRKEVKFASRDNSSSAGSRRSSVVKQLDRPVSGRDGSPIDTAIQAKVSLLMYIRFFIANAMIASVIYTYAVLFDLFISEHMYTIGHNKGIFQVLMLRYKTHQLYIVVR